MDLLRRFMHLLTFIISKTSSVYRYAAFPFAVLYNLSLSVWFEWIRHFTQKIYNPMSETLRHIFRFSFLAYLTTTIQL